MSFYNPVIEKGIQPSEFWRMSLDEIYHLLDIKFDNNQSSDNSQAVMFKMIRNGMKPHDLKRLRVAG